LLPPSIDFIDRHARANWEEECENAYGFVADRIDRKVLGAMLADIGDFLAPLLRRLDRTTMGASIECRNPFLDHRLVHAVINLPIDYKLGKRTDKWVLKRIAARYVPRRLVDRKKAGFPLPLDEYLAPLECPEFFANGFCETTLGLGHRTTERLILAGERGAHEFFGLIALEIWGRLHVLGQTVAHVEALVADCEARTPHRERHRSPSVPITADPH
jgi:asparagine synthase (glutamine-hydrolysing)